MPVNDKKLIVSVTTYPARIGCLQATLDSIFNQSLKADLVILYLSKVQFPKEQDELPEYLLKLQSEEKIVIKFVPRDIRSHKKYFYAMQEYPNDLIVVIDDDLIYEEDMLLLLSESYKKHPNAVSAMRTHLILTEGEKFQGYYDWLFESEGIIDKPSMQLYATNGAGTLYDPSLYRDDLFDEEAIMKTCLYADDMWMKANELIAGIPVVEVRGRYPLIYVDGSQEISPLLEINNVNKRNAQWAAIEEHFSNKYNDKYNVITPNYIKQNEFIQISIQGNLPY